MSKNENEHSRGCSASEKLRAGIVANDVASLVENLLGEGIYEGYNPFIIGVVDEAEMTAYYMEIRRGIDLIGLNVPWITIIQKEFDNPPLPRCYYLDQRRHGKWKYQDPYLAKYGESSLDQLEKVKSRLFKISTALKPQESTDKPVRQMIAENSKPGRFNYIIPIAEGKQAPFGIIMSALSAEIGTVDECIVVDPSCKIVIETLQGNPKWGNISTETTSVERLAEDEWEIIVGDYIGHFNRKELKQVLMGVFNKTPRIVLVGC